MGERKYTNEDRRTLKVLKMQDADLQALQERSDTQRQHLDEIDRRLAELRKRTLALAEDEDVEIPEERHYPAPLGKHREKMKLDEVPSWESLDRRSQTTVNGHVDVEHLLDDAEIKHSEEEVKRINEDFARLTGLSKTDMAFLSVATAIQATRWMMMPRLVGTIGKSAKVLAALSPSTMAMLERKPATTTDVAIVDEINQDFQQEAEWDAEEIKEEGYKSWEDILDDGAAAQSGAEITEKAFNNEAMNWIFGIINNITGTKTSGDFSTVDAVTGEVVKTPGIFGDAFRSIKEDWMRLPAAVYAQYAQEKAANGETVDMLAPVAESFSPEMLSDLYTTQFAQLASIKDLTIIGQQAAVPLIINMAVGLLHGFMYNPAKDGERRFYDARTRKILILSNALASASNLAVTISSENWAKLDIGGLLVTSLRVMQDGSYLINLKDQFIKDEMDKILEKELQDIDSHFLNLPATK